MQFFGPPNFVCRMKLPARISLAYLPLTNLPTVPGFHTYVKYFCRMYEDRFNFQGNLYYVNNPSKTADAAHILNFTVANPRKCVGRIKKDRVFGLNLSWSDDSGDQKKSMLIQISRRNRSYIFHEKDLQDKLPDQLKAFLEDPKCIKTGVGIQNTAIRLNKEFGVKMEGILDLVAYTKQQIGKTGPSLPHSLNGLCEVFLAKSLLRESMKKVEWQTKLSWASLIQAANEPAAAFLIFETARFLNPQRSETDSVILSFADLRDRKIRDQITENP